MKRKFCFFFLMLLASFHFSTFSQTLISEDFSGNAWETELIRVNPTYATPAANTAFTTLNSTSLYMGKYYLNGAIESRDVPPNCADVNITHRNPDNGGVAVAFRFRSGTAPVLDTYIEFPEISSAGVITLHVRNCNNTTNTNLYLQKYENSTWTTIKNYTIYKAENYSATSIDEIKTYDINSTTPIKLRLVGGSKFIDLFRVDIQAHYKAYLLAGINDATTLKNNNTANVGTGLGQYSQASYDTFSAAIVTAQGVNSNASATQAQVDAALTTLNAAVATFQASINKTGLQTSITNATTLLSDNAGNIGTSLGQYTQTSYNTLNAAIATATAVYNNAIATTTEVVNANTTLNAAVATFQASINKTDLQTGINNATSLKNANAGNIGGALGQYTQASYDTFSAAITTASGVYNNATATSSQVVGALSTLNNAVTAFQASVIPVELMKIDFTKDSTYWKSEFPATVVNGNNLSVSVDGLAIDGISFKGTFGKFDPGTGVRAQPIRNDNQSSKRRWAFRIDNNGTSYLKLPVLPSIGKLTIFCKNGNETIEGTFYLQQKVGSTWQTIKTLYAPPHFDRNYEQEIENYLNINTSVELRIYGASKNIHIYKVVVNSYDPAKPADKPLKLILIPDAQTYANNTEWNEVYAAQTIWVANNSDSIKFVLQQGDMTQTNGDAQWSIAAGALTIMDGKLPYTFCSGNHDMGSPGFANTRNTSMMNSYLPYSRYSRQESFGGAYPANTVDNTWHTFSHGNYNFLILSLEYGPRNIVIDWAKNVIEAHPYHNVIINTHAYLGSGNGLLNDGIPQEIGNLTGDDYANDGQRIWNKLAKLYKNVMFVFCGHILGDGEGHLISTGDNGNKVYQYLANYQGGVDGTQAERNGRLRIVDMDPENHILKIQTYSPYTDQYCTDAGQHFYYNNVQYMKSNGQYVKNQPTGTENPEYSHLTVLPGSQQVRIINEGSNNLNVIVYNLQGIRIAERTGSSNFDIPVPVSGCYIITVNDNTQSYTMRKKIVVK